MLLHADAQVNQCFSSDSDAFLQLFQHAGDFCYEAVFSNEKVQSVCIKGDLVKVSGYSISELQSMPGGFRDVVYPEDRDSYQRNHQPGKSDVKVIEYRITHKNGSLRWLKDHIYIKFDEKTDHGFTLGWVSEITNEKNLYLRGKEAEKRYAELFNNMQEGFSLNRIICDECGKVINYEFIAMNPAFEAMTGLKASECMGKTVLEILPNTEAYWIERFGAVAQTGVPLHYENYAAHFDKYFEVSAFRNAENQFACMVRDATDKNRLYEKLANSERLLNTLMQNLPGMVYRCKYDSDWTMLFVSSGCKDLTGYSVEDLIGNEKVTFDSLVLPQYVKEGYEKWQKAISEKGIFTMEYEIVDAKGNIKWVWEQGNPVFSEQGELMYLQGFIQDLSSQKRAEKALVQSEQRHRALLNALPDLMFLLDREGVFIDCHIPEGVMTLVAKEDFLGKKASQVLPQNLATLTMEKIKTLRSGGKTQVYQYQLEEGPQIRTYESRMVNCENGDFLTIIRDITEQTAHQDEIKRINEELKNFTYSVSHDLRSPLMSIKSFADFLEKDIKAGRSDRSQTNLDYIKFSVNRMNELLEGLLELSRIGRKKGNWQTVSLKELIKRISILLSASLQEHKVKLILPEKDLLLEGDSVRLAQLFQNLIENAVKFRGHNDQSRIEVGWERTEGIYKIYVRDNGKGIEPRQLGKIFELFHQIDPKAKGTGIGLTIVKRIVEVHGGSIWASSEGEGKGTTIWFTIPGLNAVK
jgi:PAS domain S-box-containing protein